MAPEVMHLEATYVYTKYGGHLFRNICAVGQEFTLCNLRIASYVQNKKKKGIKDSYIETRGSMWNSSTPPKLKFTDKAAFNPWFKQGKTEGFRVVI